MRKIQVGDWITPSKHPGTIKLRVSEIYSVGLIVHVDQVIPLKPHELKDVCDPDKIWRNCVHLKDGLKDGIIIGTTPCSDKHGTRDCYYLHGKDYWVFYEPGGQVDKTTYEILIDLVFEDEK